MERSISLLIAGQIKAFLLGEQLPYSANALDEMVARILIRTQELNKMEKECRNYWLATYFQQVNQQSTKSRNWICYLLPCLSFLYPNNWGAYILPADGHNMERNIPRVESGGELLLHECCTHKRCN